MIHAYVTTETCRHREAFRRGEEYHGRPVSKHNDLTAWTWSKRDTLKIATGHHYIVKMAGASRDVWFMQTAKAVARLLGWEK